MSYNSGSNRACNFRSASRFALVRFRNYSRDYSQNCTPLGRINITNNNNNNNNDDDDDNNNTTTTNNNNNNDDNNNKNNNIIIKIIII